MLLVWLVFFLLNQLNWHSVSAKSWSRQVQDVIIFKINLADSEDFFMRVLLN
jgi:hypothetical protein